MSTGSSRNAAGTEAQTRLSDDSRIDALQRQVASLQSSVENLAEVVKSEFRHVNENYRQAVEVLPIVKRMERIMRDHLHHEAAGGRLAESHLESL